jgi:hypothetical protein
MTDQQKADARRAAETRAADDKKKTADHIIKADDKKKQADHKAGDRHAADKHEAEDKLKVIYKGFQIEVALNFRSGFVRRRTTKQTTSTPTKSTRLAQCRCSLGNTFRPGTSRNAHVSHVMVIATGNCGTATLYAGLHV